MAFTITSLIETVANAHTLMTTLHGVRPVVDSMGRPRSRTIHGVHIFEVWNNGQHALMCCSPDNEEGLRRTWRRYIELREARPECFARLTLHENELPVFDACGHIEKIAVVMLPYSGRCMSVDDFVSYAAETDNHPALRAAMYDLVELACEMERRTWKFDLGVCFTPAGRMLVCEVERTRPRLAEMAMSLAWGMCHGRASDHTPQVKQWTELIRPLCRRLGIKSGSAEEVCRTLWDLCRVDPEGLRIIFEELHGESDTIKPHNDEYQNYELHEGVYLVECAEGFRYLDSEGHPLNDTTFVSAEPLREGRAEVATAEGWGLMDANGTLLLPTIYEELTWNENLNTCVAMRDGVWQLFDREGERLSHRPFEWIGEPSAEGLFPVEVDGLSGWIDVTGKEIASIE